jgi:Tfp pilus assembly protein PilF
MILLGERMKISLLDEQIEQRARERVNRYRERVGNLDILKTTSVLNAFAAIAKRSGGWWAWERRAMAEKDPLRIEQIYREGIKSLPKSAELRGNFANFLTVTLGKHDEAELFYKEAMELPPSSAINTGNFARFLWYVRGKHDEAELFFKMAFEINPDNADINASYAGFLAHIRGKHDEAESLYKKAIETDPKNAGPLANYASFLTDVRGMHAEAESLYKKALELDPQNAAINGKYVGFLKRIHRKNDEAESLYKNAIEFDPNNDVVTGNYANLLANVAGRHDEAEALYQRALKLNPNNANNIGNYVCLLIGKNKLSEASERLIKAKTLNEAKPNQLEAELALYEGILESASGRDDTAVIERLVQILKAGFRRLPWSFDNVLEVAREKVADEHYRIYVALAEAILDEKKVPNLDELLAACANRKGIATGLIAPPAADGNGNASSGERVTRPIIGIIGV